MERGLSLSGALFFQRGGGRERVVHVGGLCARALRRGSRGKLARVCPETLTVMQSAACRPSVCWLLADARPAAD